MRLSPDDAGDVSVALCAAQSRQIKRALCSVRVAPV